MRVLRSFFSTTILAAAFVAAPGTVRAASNETAIEEARHAFVDDVTNAEARLRAALLLLKEDPGFVRDQLGHGASTPRIAAVCSAIDQSTASLTPESAARVVPALLAAAADGNAPALATVRGLDRARPEISRPILRAALAGPDAAPITIAAQLLGESQDPHEIAPLAQLLGVTRGEGPLATAAVAALERIVPAGYGADVARWKDLARSGSNRTREELLAEMIARQRAEFEQRAALRDQEFVEVKLLLHADNRVELVKDLEDPLPAMRRRAAEALSRRVGEWDLTALSPRLLERLASATERGDVIAATTRLLVAIDLHAQKKGDDPARDRVLAKLIASNDGAVVAAAAEAAIAFEAPALKPALTGALARLVEEPLTAAARGALVEAAGRLAITEAKDVVLARLYDPDAAVRVAAAQSLGALGLPDAREHLERAIRGDADWHVRREAARSLPKVCGKSAIDGLLAGLHDSQVDVRSVAVEEAAALGGDVVVAALLERLPADPPLQIDIVKGLGVIGAKEAIDPLCNLILHLPPERGTSDPHVDQLRKSCREALASIAKSDPACWKAIVSRVASRQRPVLEAWARGQLVRALKDAGNAPKDLFDAERGFAAASLAIGDTATVLAISEARIAGADPAAPESVVDFELLKAQALAIAHEPRPQEACAVYESLLKSGKLTPAARDFAARGAVDLRVKNGELRAAIEILTALPDDAAIDLVRRLAHLEQDSGESERAVLRLRKLAGRPGLEPADRLNIALDLVEALLAAGDAAGAAKELPQDADLATWLPEEIALRLQSLRTAIRQESAARPGGG